MKGLRKVLTPFAPDQSGAATVLYSLGGMIVIIDAGGCTGNICGFDEPRWHETRAAIFSAGLRDMDAILGRDALLVSKIAAASERIDAKFIALVGSLAHDICQVLTLKRHAENPFFDKSEALLDVVDDGGRCGGSECQDRNVGQVAANVGNCEIGRAEIVAPLGYAMCFVDGDEAHFHVAQLGAE